MVNAVSKLDATTQDRIAGVVLYGNTRNAQEGGKIPVPTTKPAGDTAEVTGNLAETGSSSSTPAIALAGGAAVVLGAGAMFVVRRRRNGDAAA